MTTSYPADPGDPSGHFVASEATALARAGHRVVVVTPAVPQAQWAAGTQAAARSSASEPSVLRVGGGTAFGPPGVLARLAESPTRLFGVGRFIAAAQLALRRAGPFDEIIAHWVVPCAWPIAFGIAGDLEVVVHGSDARLLLTLPGPLRDLVLRSLDRRGARFRFVSHQLLESLAAVGPPGLRARSIVRPAAIELPAVPSRAVARAELGVAPTDDLIVIVGRLVREKRIAVAVGAAALVPGARVVVVGDGPERPRISAAFPAVELVGALPRPATLRWMSAADLLVSASLREGAPTTIREARQLGVPVVAAPAGDLAAWAAVDPGIIVVSRPEGGRVDPFG